MTVMINTSLHTTFDQAVRSVSHQTLPIQLFLVGMFLIYAFFYLRPLFQELRKDVKQGPCVCVCVVYVCVCVCVCVACVCVW